SRIERCEKSIEPLASELKFMLGVVEVIPGEISKTSCNFNKIKRKLPSLSLMLLAIQITYI
ncbi:MAG: hypothetical protein ACI840_000030, partial [Ulvibacter sp.]